METAASKGIPHNKYSSYRHIRVIGDAGNREVIEVDRGGRRFAMRILKDIAYTVGDKEPLRDLEDQLRVWLELMDLAPEAVMPLRDYGVDEYPWIVMDMADGDYTDVLKEGTASVKDVMDLLWMLRSIHDSGRVHKDIRPENILFVGDKWRFGDFGLSTSRRQADGGSLRYLAPEQLEDGRFVGIRADIWHMGVIAYIVLTGTLPFDDPDDEELSRRIRSEDPDYSLVPAAYEPILRKALAKDPEARYGNADEFADAIGNAMASGLPEERPGADLGSRPIGSLTAAAEAGDVSAQKRLGDAYCQGFSVPRSYEEALRLYSRASDSGDPEAIRKVAGMLYAGRGSPVDYERAFEWYHRAAQLGDAEAQAWTGVMYRDGRGVRQSYDRASYWFTQAAFQGDMFAQNALGALHYRGNGVEHSYSDAAFWFRKAADQGSASAQGNLANMYYFGLTGEQSYEEAYKWAKLSADQGNEEARILLVKLAKKGYGDAEAKPAKKGLFGRGKK